MSMIYWAILALVAFIAIWFLFVAPAERRHHERKLANLQRKIDARQANDEDAGDSGEKTQELQ